MTDMVPCTGAKGQTQGKGSFPAGDVQVSLRDVGGISDRGLQTCCGGSNRFVAVGGRRVENTQETIPKGLQSEVTCLGDSGGSPVGTSSKLAPCGIIPVSPSPDVWRA